MSTADEAKDHARPLSDRPQSDWPYTEEFEEFYRSAFRTVVVTLTAINGDFRFAEDATQDAMIAAHGVWERIREYDRPEAWVFRVARQRYTKRAISRRERGISLDDIPLEYNVGDNDADAIENQQVLMSAIKQLPRRQREVVAYHYLADLSIKDVALIMGISEGAVSAHTNRALTSLRRQIGDPEAGSAPNGDAT